MARLQLPIDPNYVRWGIWECLRELVQNAKDGDDRGFPSTIGWSKANDGTVTLHNEGASFGREMLRLGGGNKCDDDDQRGQFGEGMKLSWIRLLAADRALWIRVGAERWIPTIEKSPDFGGGEVLFVSTRKCDDKNDVHIEVRGISKDEWQGVIDRILFLAEPGDDEVINTSRGRVLKGDRYRGRLYSKGIYVCDLNGDWKYGFDLDRVNLDRDRKVPDQWSLEWEVKETFAEATTKGLITVSEAMLIMDGDTRESAVFEKCEHSFGDDSEFVDKIAERFIAAHGDKAVPVSGMAEVQEAEHVGLKPVVVSKGMRAVVERSLGPLAARKKVSASEVVRRVQVSEMTPVQVDTLTRMCGEISAVTGWDGNAQVVEYQSDDICGTRDGLGQVCVSVVLLDDPAELFATLVHEVSHAAGRDGSVDHERAIEQIFSRIAVKLMDLEPGEKGA